MHYFYSPLRYPGGKTDLAVFLNRIIEKKSGNKKKIILVEPYAGGAGASLKLLFEGGVNKIIINDLDKAVYSFWKVAVSQTNYLINKLKDTEITIAEWKRQHAIYRNRKSTIKSLAFAVLFLNRTNRSGIIEAGPIGGMEQRGVWRIEARFNKKTIIERLKKIQDNKKNIKVCSLDGVSLLRKLEKQRNNKDYFIFLDPPYFDKGQSLYLNHYIGKDHKNLSVFLSTTSLKWVMTYDDIADIWGLYSNFKKRRFKIQHSAHKSKIGKEIMIFSKSIAPRSVR